MVVQEVEVAAAGTLVPAQCCQFLEQLRHARERALLIDYDGTLSPLVANRAAAKPYPLMRALIQSLMMLGGMRVVVLSGRPAREIPRLLGLDPHPEIWGSHGLERLTCDDHYSVGHVGERALAGLEEAAGWAAESGFAAFFERKPGAIALHWRDCESRVVERIRELAYQRLAPIACRDNLLLCEFDGGIELRARACDKGHAVRSILAELHEESAIAYLGDDVTDEDAFRALTGRGLTVLVRPQYRPTKAEVWLRPPDDLLRFLRAWIIACGGHA